MTTRGRPLPIDVDPPPPDLLWLGKIPAEEVAHHPVRAELADGADNEERLPDVEMLGKAAA